MRSLSGVFTKRTVISVAVLVVVLVVVDVVLVTLALSRTAPESGGRPGPVPTFSSTPTSNDLRSSSPRPSATSSPSAAASADGGGARLLSAVDGVTAWRSTRSQCGGATVLERTTDGGVTWQQVDLDDDVDAVYAIRALSGSISVVVGVGTDCEPAVRTSTDNGKTWKAGAVAAAGAAVTPAGLFLKTGVAPSPCPDPREAFQGSYTTAIVCASGVVEWRQGSGVWIAVPVAGIESLTDAGNTYTVARSDVPGCAGISVGSLPAAAMTTSSTVSDVGCASAARGESPAISRAGQATWLWAGATVLVSEDGGATW